LQWVGAATLNTMSTLKDQLRADLTASMKARDELRLATIRMTLTAITGEEVSGSSVRELSDEDVLRVITREAKKRRESAEAYDAAGRAELADRERAEGLVLAGYLPAALSEDELAAMVTAAIAETGAREPRQMGLVMKALQPRTAGRADGKAVSEEVRRQLTG
jgi:uncharacterized protein